MQQSGENTRQALIAAASDLLTQGGPVNVTLRAVGAAAAVSRTAPYRHFQDKDDLLSAVAAESLVVMTAKMQRALDEADGPNRLFAACLAYVRVAWDHPNHYRLGFGGDHTFEPSAVLRTAASDFNKYFTGVIAEAQNDGTLTPADIDDVGPLVWVLLHGLAMSNHLAVDGAAYGLNDLHRVLDLGLRNLAPR